MNKVILVGNLGADAELRVLGSGDAVANFRVATSEKWNDRDGNKQERTEWHRCALWGKRAEAIAQYLRKGTKVVVEGSIQTRSYEKDGEKRYATDIRVSNVEFAGGGKKADTSDDEMGDSVNDSSPASTDDIPF